MENYFKTVIISGKIASGKTTLAKKLAEELNAIFISFGDFLRYQSIQNNQEPTREYLQNLGINYISKYGHQGFVSLVFNHFSNLSTNTTNYFIVDGVRHIPIFEEIRKISKKTILIYLDIDKEQLYKNIANRDSFNKETLDKFLTHNVENELDNLKNYAEILIKTLPDISDITRIKESVLSILYAD